MKEVMSWSRWGIRRDGVKGTKDEEKGGRYFSLSWLGLLRFRRMIEIRAGE